MEKQPNSEKTEKSRSLTGKIIFLLLLFVFLGVALKIGWNYYQNWQNKQAALHFDLAENYYHSKRYQEAITEYKIVTTKYPKTEFVPASWYKTGYIYYKFLYKYDLAQEAFELLLKEYPDGPYLFDALYCLLDIYSRQGSLNDVIRIARELSQRFHGKVDLDSLWLTCAEAYARMFKMEEAYQQILKIENKDSYLVKNSQIYYQILAVKEPTNPQPHYELARIYKDIGLKEKSRIEFETAQWLKLAQKHLPKKKLLIEKAAPRGSLEEKVLPKKKISTKEEKLYIDYMLALEKHWPREMAQYSMSLEQAKINQDIKVFYEKMQIYRTQWWEKWYKTYNTTSQECEELVRKVASDKGLEQLLREKINKEEIKIDEGEMKK